MALIYQKKNTFLMGLLVSLICTAAGFGSIWLGHAVLGESFWKEVLKDVGGALLGIGVLSFLWELFAKRSFRDETLSLVNIAATVEKAGIEVVELAYLEIDWKTLFAFADRLDVFFAYGATWQSNHSTALKKLVKEKKVQVRVLLPDPNCPECVAELTRRFVGYTTEKTMGAIRDSIAAFTKLQDDCRERSSVEVRLTKVVPVFTMYNFGAKAVFALYRHRPGKGGDVPTYIVRPGGTLYSFLDADFNHLWQTAGQVPPTQPPGLSDGNSPQI